MTDLDPAKLSDYQLKWAAMLMRSQLSRRRRPVTAKVRAGLEAKLPRMLAECEHRGIDASWRAYRALRAEADGPDKPEPARMRGTGVPAHMCAAEALQALEAAIERDIRA